MTDIMYRCLTCGDRFPASEIRMSWEITAITIDEPFGTCPACFSPDIREDDEGDSND